MCYGESVWREIRTPQARYHTEVPGAVLASKREIARAHRGSLTRNPPKVNPRRRLAFDLRGLKKIPLALSCQPNYNIYMQREIWRAHPSIPGLMLSDRGAVQYKDRRRKCNPHNTWWYHQLFINGKSYQVHRLIAETFIGPIPPLYVINHKDGNKTNNHVKNLEICTAAQNTKHAHDMGLHPPRYRVTPTSKLITEILKSSPPYKEPKREPWAYRPRSRKHSYADVI